MAVVFSFSLSLQTNTFKGLPTISMNPKANFDVSKNILVVMVVVLAVELVLEAVVVVIVVVEAMALVEIVASLYLCNEINACICCAKEQHLYITPFVIPIFCLFLFTKNISGASFEHRKTLV